MWRRRAVLAAGLVATFTVAWAQPAPAQVQPTAESDGLPPRAWKRLGTEKMRHGSRILCLAFSPNGRILAAGGGNDPVRLWDTETGKELRHCPEPWVYGMVFSPRGSVLATAGAFTNIRLWEVVSGKEIGQLKGHKAAIKALAISPDGTMIASGDQNGVIKLWELITQREITQLKGHTDEINSLTFSPDNNRLASGSTDRSVRIWDVESTKHLHTLDGGCSVASVTFLDDGKLLASGGDDNLIRLWDSATGKSAGVLKGHQGFLATLLSSRDGKTLYSGAQDQAVRLWDPIGKKEIRTIARPLGNCDALALSKDNKLLAAAGINNTIRLFDAASGKEIVFGNGHQAPLTSLALSPLGNHLVTASTTGQVRAWDVAAGKDTGHWQAGAPGETLLAYAPDGLSVASANGTAPVRLWDPITGLERGKVPGPADDSALALAFAPDSKTIAVGYRQSGVRIFRLDGHVVHQLKYAGAVSALAFSADGKTLAVSGSFKIALWDLTAGKELRVFDSKEGAPATLPSISCLAFTPDGKTLAAGSFDAVLRLFDTASGKEIRSMEGHQSAIFSLAFSADGRTLASGSFDKTVRLWETFSGAAIAVGKGHTGPVNALAFTPNGRTVLSASSDTSVLYWDVTGMSTQGQLPSVTLNKSELEAAWLEMASLDAARGHSAVWRLVASKGSIAFLAGEVRLDKPMKIDQLLNDLNADKFAVREKATLELSKYGQWVKSNLRAALKSPPSEEVRRRVEKLLAKLDLPGSLSAEQEILRVRRLMIILEQLADAPARKLMESLGDEALDENLRTEARVSLIRLGKHK